MQHYSFSNYTHAQILSEKDIFQKYIPGDGVEWFVRSSAQEKQ
jgi:hypothetical protein